MSPDPRRDERGLLRLTKYLKRPRTIEEIRDHFELSERSVYRWFEYLRGEGEIILSRRIEGEVRFSLEVAA